MKFEPSFGLKNRHIQTLYASFFRKFKPLAFESEIFELSDGDFIEAYWYKHKKHTPSTPIIILFHGLTGSYASPYIQGAVRALNKAGYSCVVMHFRGCSGKENRKARSYHSGDTQDAQEFIHSLHIRYPNAALGGVGYSLGANMLLKYLGQTQEKSLLKTAAAVSAPMLLDVCATQMQKGFSQFYQKILLKDLQKSLLKKYDKHPMQQLIGLKKEDVKKLKTFWLFDEAYTAKINNFASAKEYYKKSSAMGYLKEIQTPTLIIHAKDDPFMTPEVIPNKSDISKSITLQILENGGHVGFISGTLLHPKYWLDKRVTTFFQEHIHI